MMISRTVSILIWVVLISQSCFTCSVNGECCPSITLIDCAPAGGAHISEVRCDDCSRGNPYCGRDLELGCNRFGCWCYDGCRTGACSKCLRYVQGSTGTAIGKRKREVNTRNGRNSTRIVDEIMVLADQNRDGRLSTNESLEYLRSINDEEPTPDDVLKDAIVAMDLNKDGFLTPSEIDPDY